jgi:hypothetical protein
MNEMAVRLTHLSGVAYDEAVHFENYVTLLGTKPSPQLKGKVLGARYEEAIQFALSCWQVAPIISAHIERAVGPKGFDGPHFQTLRDFVVATRVLSTIQHRLLLRTLGTLRAANIPAVALKGGAAAFTAYENPEMRCSMDVDLGVPRNNLQAAEMVVRDLGFFPASLDESGRRFLIVGDEDREFEKEHYELACMVRRQRIRGLDAKTDEAIRRSIKLLRPWHITEENELACYVSLDIHHGLCLDISVDDLVKTSIRKVVGSGFIWLPTAEWMVLHLIFKIYWEGVHNYRKGLYQYADLIRLVPALSDREANRLLDLLTEYSLRAAAFYVLRRLATEFHAHLPAPLKDLVESERLAPRSAHPDDCNDSGDMWPKLFGHR